MTQLPEFRVTLTRLAPGETAYPPGDHSFDGRRTKLGGAPDWEQGDEHPNCPECGEPMSFVAQIDSVEHEKRNNPHGRPVLGDDQHWMFGDVGMIYVFFCFDCIETAAVMQGS